MTSSPLRFGVLGAARIAPKALMDPLSTIDSALVTRVAARDRNRAMAFASDEGINGVADSYQALIEADDVDVVYNPLPMHLHAQWTIAALRAGKHVLCEKPFASNALEAAEMVRVADEEGLMLGEAFHHHYHPLFQRILSVVASGAIGDVTRIEGFFNIAIAKPDIRWDYATSGGSLMDLGCYPLMWARHVMKAATPGVEPTVTAAEATVEGDRIDAQIWVELEFPGGATARVESSMIQTDPDVRLEITGTKGSIAVDNPLAPQNGNSLTIRSESGETSGQFAAGSTYEHMVRSFCDHVIHGTAFETKGNDSIANMAAIDSIYTAAGLPLRGM